MQTSRKVQMKTIWMRELTLLSCLFKQPYSVVSGLFRPVLILPPARRFRPHLPPVGMVAGICINYSPYHCSYYYYTRPISDRYGQMQLVAAHIGQIWPDTT